MSSRISSKTQFISIICVRNTQSYGKIEGGRVKDAVALNNVVTCPPVFLLCIDKFVNTNWLALAYDPHGAL